MGKSIPGIQSKYSMETLEKVILGDMGKVIRALEKQLANLIDGLEVYKNAFETVATQLCSTSLQVVHEIILNESQRA